ncbi:MAG: type II toxin-antitoxin system PemK/MazF family toxin [Spirochaetales bacterium]|nr:type II toxin-antitoxin system PemK/MazF family toxin [Spirochaetales bacterium]
MTRGELYRVYRGSKHDTKNFRVFAVVSRQVLIDSKFSTVICAPVYSNYSGISTQVPVGIEEGLKHHNCIHCDELISIPKTVLTNYIGFLPADKIEMINNALMIALGLEE